MEKMTNSSGTAYRYYIPAGNNFIVYNRWLSGTNAIYYATKDNIDSTAVITDSKGALAAAEKFSALGWGENNPQATIASISRHEFTGQEMLNNLGMVNMNGRVYQPSGARFYSPDPHIPDPQNNLDYNRYAYVDDNPLTLIDPTGFCGVSVNDDGSVLVDICASPPIPDICVGCFTPGNWPGIPYPYPNRPPSKPQQPQQTKLTQCLKAFVNTAPTTTPYPTITPPEEPVPVPPNPLLLLGAALGALLSGDTPQGHIYYHYGYASQSAQFANGIRPGGYGTPDLVIVSGATAQQIYALPPQNSIDSPPDARYTINAPPGTPVVDLGPVGQTSFPPGPGNPTGDTVTRSGGGNEVTFPKGTPPGSVSGPEPLPRC